MGRLPSSGGVLLGSLCVGEQLRELSLFIGESGSDDSRGRYYLLTLVFHVQDEGVSESICLYGCSLIEKGLLDIPFYASPLLNGHDGYENMGLADRKRLLSSFRVFFCYAPVRCACITLETKGYGDLDGVTTAMCKHLADFLFDELAYSQNFMLSRSITTTGGSRLRRRFARLLTTSSRKTRRSTDWPSLRTTGSARLLRTSA